MSKKKLKLDSKTYELEHLLHKGKAQKIYNNILKPYIKDAETINRSLKVYFYKGTKLNKNKKYSFNIKASKRYTQTIQYQVIDQLKGYFENLKEDFVPLVYKSSVASNKELVKQLFYINKAELWQANFDTLKPKIKKKLSKEALKLAKDIFRWLRSKNRWPTLRWSTMKLDAKVAIISHKGGPIGQSKKLGKSVIADYWIKLSNYTGKNKKEDVQIPLLNNKYFKNAPGRRSNNCQIQYEEGKIIVKFLRNKLIKLPIQQKTSIPSLPIQQNTSIPSLPLSHIAVDEGLCNRLATNKGDLLGRNFKKTLDYFDGAKVKISNALRLRNRSNIEKTIKDKKQRKHYKAYENKRYKALNRRQSEYIKNEIGRVFNRLIAIHHPDVIHTESLNFQGSSLSKKMNRHLHRFGQGRFQEKIEESLVDGLIQQHLIKETPYSSQICYKCKYVDENNRHGEKFECLVCKNKIHADVNAPNNLLNASCISGRSKQEILARSVLVSVRNLQNKPLSQDSIRRILANPYYVDYHKDFFKRLRSFEKQKFLGKGKLSLTEKKQPQVSSFNGTLPSRRIRRSRFEEMQSSRLNSRNLIGPTIKEFPKAS